MAMLGGTSWRYLVVVGRYLVAMLSVAVVFYLFFLSLFVVFYLIPKPLKIHKNIAKATKTSLNPQGGSTSDIKTILHCTQRAPVGTLP